MRAWRLQVQGLKRSFRRYFTIGLKKYIQDYKLCICSDSGKWACGQKIDSVVEISDEFSYKCTQQQIDYYEVTFSKMLRSEFTVFFRFASKLHVYVKFTELFHKFSSVSLKEMKIFLTK